MRRNGNAIKETLGDATFNTVIIVFLIIVNIVMLYPFIYVLSTSISDQSAVMAGDVWLYPIGFDLTAMNEIMYFPGFLNSYKNTIIYSVSATVLTLAITSFTAYPLSRPEFKMRGFITKIYLFTMFFGGGMIPTFLVYRAYGFVDNPLVMIIPGALSAYNLIIMRTFFQGIPSSLHESAYLDGANDMTIWLKIVLPLSKPVLATIALFTMVGVWNNFFTGLLYFNDADLYPLQLILRMILINASMQASSVEGSFADFDQTAATESLKSASIVISIIPIVCVYPFVQKYFVKGVMIGAVKG